MNHNTARCVGCNSIVQLPHLRAKASAAKCEACARREAERVRELRSDEYATSPSQMNPRYMRSYPGTFVEDKLEQRTCEVRGSLAAIMGGMWPGDQPDHLEQIARELTEEKRREERWWQFETRVSWDREEFIYSTGYGTDSLKLKVTIDMDTLHKHLNAANGCYQDSHYLPDFEARFDADGGLVEMRKLAR